MTEINEIFSNLQNKLDSKDYEIETLKESLGNIALRIDEAGWHNSSDVSAEGVGPTLVELKTISKTIRELTTNNPLLKRGCELRGSYVFGNGMTFRNVKAAAQSVIDGAHNYRVLFSRQGQEELNRAKYTDGNVFLMYDETTKKTTRVPLSQIEDIGTNPDDSEDVWWVLRKWTHNDTLKSVWYRMSDMPKRAEKPSTLEGTVIAPSTQVMFLETSNKQIGWTLGVPDALAAVLWTMAYTEYLNNNTRLVAAYARFAMKVTSQTSKAVKETAGTFRQRGDGVGGTALQTEGNSLSHLPATGSSVDFTKGQPLAGMVASSLGVSVIALLSSPAAAGGSYGAAATLDAPTIIGMSAIQDTWATFYQNFLRYLGSKDAIAEFPAIETDATYRTIGQLPALVDAGIIHREEARNIVIDLLDVRDPKKELPEIVVPTPTTQDNGKDNIESGDTNNDERTDLISK